MHLRYSGPETVCSLGGKFGALLLEVGASSRTPTMSANLLRLLDPLELSCTGRAQRIEPPQPSPRRRLTDPRGSAPTLARAAGLPALVDVKTSKLRGAPRPGFRTNR